MIREWLSIAVACAVLAGCSPSKYTPPVDAVSSPGSNTDINISGSAVAGVAGGSGQSTQFVSGIKDLSLSVGVNLGDS